MLPMEGFSHMSLAVCDFDSVFLSILRHKDLFDRSVDLDMMVEKACCLMVLCQGVFYAKKKKKLFCDKHLINSSRDNIKTIDTVYVKHVNSIMGNMQSPETKKPRKIVDRMVRYHKGTALSEIHRELKRCYDFEYLSKKDQKSLIFEINHNIFQWIDIIPVVFSLRYEKQPYKSAINNTFWASK